jgi:hypothetical protein
MSRKSSTDDYRFKSCMFYQNVRLWISGSYLQKRAADKHPYELYLQLNEGRAYEDQGEEPTNERDL